MFKKSCSIILLCLLCIATAWANTATVSVKYNDAVIADYASGFNVEVWENGTKTGNGVRNTDGTYTVNFAADSCQVKVEDGNSSLPVYYLKSAASTSSVKNGDSVTADMGKLAYLSGSMPATANGTVVLSEDGIVAAPGCASVSVTEGYKLYTTPVSGYKLYYMDAGANLTEVSEAISGDFTSNSITLAEGDNKTANIGGVVQKGTISVTVTGLPSGASMPTVSANGTPLSSSLTGDFAPGSYNITASDVTFEGKTYCYTPSSVTVEANKTASVTVEMKEKVVPLDGTIEVSVTGLPDGADNPTVKIGDTELSYNSETKKYSGSFAPGTDYVLTVSAVTVDEDTYAATSQTPENPLTVVSDQTTSVEVSMEKAEGIKVTFNVTFRNDGKPCNNAVVELVQGSDDPYAASLTDKAGEYVVFVPEGTYTVSVSNADADPATSIDPELDSNGQYSVTEDVTFDVVVPGGVPQGVTFQAFRELETKPAPGVAFKYDGVWGSADADGMKTFDAETGKDVQIIPWPGYFVNSVSDENGEISANEDGTYTVSGSLVKVDIRKCVSCTVVFKAFRATEDKPAKGVAVKFNDEWKLTDENGEAVFTDVTVGDYAAQLVPWKTYDLLSVADDNGEIDADEDGNYPVSVNGNVTVNIDMRPIFLAGKAVDANGEALANFTFFAGDTEVTTDEDGAFKVRVEKGSYEIFAEDYLIDPEVVEVTGCEDEEQTIVFTKAYSFSGTLTHVTRGGKVPYSPCSPILIATNVDTYEEYPIYASMVSGESEAAEYTYCTGAGFDFLLPVGTYEISFYSSSYYANPAYDYSICRGNTTITIGEGPVSAAYKIQSVRSNGNNHHDELR